MLRALLLSAAIAFLPSQVTAQEEPDYEALLADFFAVQWVEVDFSALQIVIRMNDGYRIPSDRAVIDLNITDENETVVLDTTLRLVERMADAPDRLDVAWLEREGSIVKVYEVARDDLPIADTFQDTLSQMDGGSLVVQIKGFGCFEPGRRLPEKIGLSFYMSEEPDSPLITVIPDVFFEKIDIGLFQVIGRRCEPGEE